MASKLSNVLMEDARIIFRNFKGEEGMYNREGDRNFAVILPDELAEQLKKDGWNVKYLKAREEGETDTPYLAVAVSYKGRPPMIKMIGGSSKRSTTLDESTVEILDMVDIDKVDLVFGPYEWNVRGETGVKAYLQSIYVTIIEDPLQLKYDAMEISTVNGPAMASVEDPLRIHSVRGELKELER
jgi:hypothetical protein